MLMVGYNEANIIREFKVVTADHICQWKLYQTKKRTGRKKRQNWLLILQGQYDRMSWEIYAYCTWF